MFPASVGSSSRVPSHDPISSRSALQAQPENQAGSVPAGEPSASRPVPRPHRLQIGFQEDRRDLLRPADNEIAEVSERLPQYAEDLPPRPENGPNAHLNSLIHNIDNPDWRYKLKSKMPNNNVPVGSRAIAIRELKKYLGTLGIDGNENRIQREYALRSLAHRTNSLKPNSQSTAIRVLHRYLAPGLHIGPKSGTNSYKSPRFVQFAQIHSEAGRRNIIHQGARMEILQMLLQEEHPLPLAERMDVLEIALDNHADQEKIANPEIRRRLLTWMQSAVRNRTPADENLLRISSIKQRFDSLAARIRDASLTDPIVMSGNQLQQLGDNAYR